MRVLALDVGDRRIGVAVSDPDGRLAVPLKTIHRSTLPEDLAQIARLASQEEAHLILVGLPLSLDGSEGPQATAVRGFAGSLAPSVGVPVEFWDERFSTFQAEQLLRGRPRSKKARAMEDALAAAIILQSYLDSKAGAA